jgi:23S rRNA pseudouridine1911/1915/1917 synthase
MKDEISVTVGESAGSGVRLDRYCAALPGAISRSRLKNGATSITVNGLSAKFSRIVKPGDAVVISWEDPEPDDLLPEAIDLDVLYEDDQVTVVNKRQGMVTHPAAGNWSGTLVNALLWRWKAAAPEGNPRPGIVHRLDKDTSGVIITARSIDALTWLQGQFKSRLTKKVYFAVLRGVPRQLRGEIKTQLVRDPKNRKRFTWSLDPSVGKAAHTSYKVLKTRGPYSLVAFRLHTGRTHQIRVHSLYLGCPILGDPIYGKRDALFPTATLMLHAHSLKIRLPGAASRRIFVAPVPPRFRKVLKALARRYPG